MVQIVGAGRAAPGPVSRSDREKPLIHDSIHGQKYVQRQFLGKVCDAVLITQTLRRAASPQRGACLLFIVHCCAEWSVALSRFCSEPLTAQGGFGTCYEVKEVSTDEILAIKIAPKKHLDASQSKRRHLQDEIQIHSSLSVRIRGPARNGKWHDLNLTLARARRVAASARSAVHSCV